MPHTIAIANKKGGVGKTTTTGYLGTGLAAEGRRVLVVDLDDQAHLSQWLLTKDAWRDLDKDIVDAVLNGAPLADSIVPTQWERLDLAPASMNLSGLEIGLVAQTRREERLKWALEGVADRYDYVLLDCPPSSNLLAQNAMAAADWILSPLEAKNFAIAGLASFWQWVEAMRKARVHDAKWLGLLPTCYDPQTRIAKEMPAILSRFEIAILPAVPERIGQEDLITVRTVAGPRRRPTGEGRARAHVSDIYDAYQLALQFVITTVEGPQLVQENRASAQGA